MFIQAITLKVVSGVFRLLDHRNRTHIPPVWVDFSELKSGEENLMKNLTQLSSYL